MPRTQARNFLPSIGRLAPRGRHQIIRYGRMSFSILQRGVIYILLLQSQSRFLTHKVILEN